MGRPWRNDRQEQLAPSEAQPDLSGRRIATLVAALILASGCAVAAALAHLRTEDLRSGQKLTGALAQVIGEQTSRTFQLVDQRLQLAASRLDALRADRRLDDNSARVVLREQLIDMAFVPAMWVLDAQGRTVFDSGPGASADGLANRESFEVHRRQPVPATHIGAPERSRSTGRWQLSVSRPLRGTDGAFSGVIVAAVEAPHFDALWRELDLGADSAIALFRRDGVLLIRSPALESAMGKSYPELPLFTQQLPQSTQGQYQAPSPFDRQARNIFFRVLAPYPDLIVTVGRTHRDMLADWVRFATYASAIWLAGAAAVAVFAVLLARQARQRRHTDAQFGRLAQAMPEIVFTSDAAGRVKFVNDQWTALTGLPSQAALERGWAGVIHPDDAAVADDDALQRLLAAGDNLPSELRLRCADGSYRWHLVRATPNRDRAGRIVSWYGTATDVDDLKQTEAALRAQVTLTRMAGEIARVGGWAYDLPGQRFTWSEQALSVLGLAPGSASKLESALALCAPAWREQATRLARDCLEHGIPFDFELEMLVPGGGTTWVRSMGRAVRDDAGVIVRMQGALQDISQRKLAQQELIESKQRLAALFDAAPVPMWVMDQASHRNIAVNAAAIRAYGYSRDEFLAMTPVDLRPASEQPRMRALMAAGLPMGQPEAWLHRRKDGSEFPVELVREAMRYGDQPAVFAVAFDVSLRVQAERENTRLLAKVRDLNSGLEARIARRTRELSRQEAMFRALAEQAPEPIWTVDPRGHATFFSHAWYQLVGGEPPQWQGYDWLPLLHPDDVAPTKRKWLAARRNGMPYSGTRRLRSREGKYHTTSYRASPVLGEDGEIAFWVGIDADITELKEVEAALRRSNDELQAFSYSVSHDLRSPLTTLAGFTRLLAAEFQGNDSARVRHYQARIDASILQMGQLIDGLLALAKVSRGALRREPVDLGAMAGEILARLQAGEPDRRHRFRIEPGLIAQADSRMMRSVLENLLANAWKFSSRRECTEIDVGFSPEFEAFSVHDNGAGFDMAYADKLFTPFQRLHAASDFAGTGVGLATVGRVVSRHGGRIWAEAAPDRGATFYFTLPAAG